MTLRWLVSAVVVVLGSTAHATTCPWEDLSAIDRVGTGCPVVVYAPATLADPDLPARVLAIRAGAELDVATGRTIAVESRDVEHTAYCGTTPVAMRTDHETFQKVTLEVTGLVAGEAVSITSADGVASFGTQVVQDGVACRTTPIENTWCGSSYPGECPAGDPTGPDPTGGGDAGAAGGCITSGPQSSIVGLLILPWLALPRRGRGPRVTSLRDE